MPRCGFLLLLLLLLFGCIDASVWDPHPLPPNPQPFFEGWYMRATLDQRHSDDTIALLFAAAQLPPPSPGQAPLPAVYIALLHGDSQAQQTFVYEATPPLSSVQVTVRGHSNVTTQPDWRTAPEFTWRAEGGGGSLAAVMEGKHLLLRAEVGGGAAKLWCEVEVADWVYDGGVARPHSWTDVAPGVKLHWYIHSLSSPAYLRLELPAENRVLEARGIAHLEKNWGSRFPHAWLWAQGSAHLASAAAGAVSFVISYGAVGSDAAGPFTHFAHFRDEGKGLAWDFKPDDSFVSTDVDGCVREFA
jgi:hypothetical protein